MGEEARTIPKCEGISPLDQALSSPNFSYYEHLRALLCSYLPKTAIALIDRTFYVADVAHRDQKKSFWRTLYHPSYRCCYCHRSDAS